MIRRTITRSEYDASPHAAWNAFVDILAMESRENLSPIQQPAHFAFWYYSEVENGGHLQYFENWSIQHGDAPLWINTALDALQVIGAVEHHRVLVQARDRWLARPRPRIGTVDQYVATALAEEFDDLDQAYSQCRPEMTVLLENYLRSHFAEFIEIV